MISGLPYNLVNSVKCSEEDFSSLNRTISKLQKLCNKTFQEGLLSIDDEVFKYFPRNKFARFFIRQAVDGVDSDSIRDIGLNLLVSSKDTGIKLIEKALIVEIAYNMSSAVQINDYEDTFSSYISFVEIWHD